MTKLFILTILQLHLGFFLALSESKFVSVEPEKAKITLSLSPATITVQNGDSPLILNATLSNHSKRPFLISAGMYFWRPNSLFGEIYLDIQRNGKSFEDWKQTNVRVRYEDCQECKVVAIAPDSNYVIASDVS